MENAQRADCAQAALAEYRRAVGDDEDSAGDLSITTIDLLTDLLHLFKQEGENAVELLHESVLMTEIHFGAEG